MKDKFFEQTSHNKCHYYHNSPSCSCIKLQGDTVAFTSHFPSVDELKNVNLIPCTCVDHPLVWDIEVMGASGSAYIVNSSFKEIKCSCIDFKTKKNICKHIQYLFFKVLDQKVDMNQN